MELGVSGWLVEHEQFHNSGIPIPLPTLKTGCWHTRSLGHQLHWSAHQPSPTRARLPEKLDLLGPWSLVVPSLLFLFPHFPFSSYWVSRLLWILCQKETCHCAFCRWSSCSLPSFLAKSVVVPHSKPASTFWLNEWKGTSGLLEGGLQKWNNGMTAEKRAKNFAASNYNEPTTELLKLMRNKQDVNF